MEKELSNLRGILQENRKQLFTRANVVATGLGFKVAGGKKTSTLSIICSVVQKLPSFKLAVREMIPSQIGGLPVDVVQTGVIRALQSPTARYRPAPGGRFLMGEGLVFPFLYRAEFHPFPLGQFPMGEFQESGRVRPGRTAKASKRGFPGGPKDPGRRRRMDWVK